MSIIIELIPDRPALFKEDTDALSTPETSMVERFQSAYHQRFTFYERQLTETLGLLHILSPALAPSHFPRISIVFDGEEEEVIFDFSLYESLLEIYVFEGWEGILQIERALNERLPPSDVDSPSGGVRVNEVTLWLTAREFFRFTRNLLALFIRESLAAIEQKAAVLIANGLSTSAEQLKKAWDDDFRFYAKEVYEYRPLPEGHYVKTTAYACRNKELSDALFQTLSEAIKIRLDYDRSLKRIQDIQGKLDEINKNREQGILATPYADVGEENLAIEMQLAEQTKKLLNSILKIIHKSSPLGLIVLDGLKVGFDQPEMEHKLGAALDAMRQKMDVIGLSIDPRASRVDALIPPVVIGDLQRWAPPEKGIENFVANIAVERLADDPGSFPLAHEATWHRLVESGAVAKDSFEYIVYFHYVSALFDRFGVEQEAEQASEKFWKTFGKIAATLSLASLATPATAEFAPVLQGVSEVAGLVAMAHAIYSITGNLVRLNQLLAEELVHPDAFALEHLARIGELTQIRREALDNITEQVAFELVLSAGARWNLVKKLMLARGYYFDLETLLDDGEE